MKLLLFDIDGILVKFNQFPYWKILAKKHFDEDISNSKLYTSGMTDRQILFEHLKIKGYENPEEHENFQEAIMDIGNVAAQFFEESQIKTIENVEKFIKAVLEKGHTIGLLTGNTNTKAKAKLKKAGLWDYFKFGAFGHLTKVRSELVPIALQNAKEKTGIEFSKENTFVIGDTTRDVQCAKDGGVKSIAVATGSDTIEQLKASNPDLLFEDFSDIEKIMGAIE